MWHFVIYAKGISKVIAAISSVGKLPLIGTPFLISSSSDRREQKTDRNHSSGLK